MESVKRQKRKSKRPNGATRKQRSTAGNAPNDAARRGFLRKLRNGAIATVAVGGGGWLLIGKVRATMREQDLTQIGNGNPTVVQIHDPQCPQCTALQREARDAVCEVGDDRLQFVVANIRSPEGRRLASAHGVGHVTLLLFDAAGKRQGILAGPNDRAYLANAFRRHLARHGKS